MLKQYIREVDNTSWLDKYRPLKINDLTGNNKITARRIVKWLTDFEKEKIKCTALNIDTNINNKKNKDSKKKKKKVQFKSNIPSSMLVKGSHGTGKTTIVEVALRSLNYNIKTINFASFRIKNKNMKDIFRSSDIISLIKRKKSKNIAIIIDGIESITSTNEKKNIEELQKENKLSYRCPIIFISNNQHNKFLIYLKKKSIIIDITPLPKKDLMLIVESISKKENLNLDDKLKMIIIDHSQSDIGRLLIILQELQYIFKDEIITEDNIKEYLKSSKRKDLDKNLFNATRSLLYNYKNMSECNTYYETDKVVVPLMIHENYIKYINYNVKDEKTKLDISDTILTNLSYGDVIENYIYSNQYWNLQEIQGFHTCAVPSYCLSNSRDKRSSYTTIELGYSKDLNKASIKNINKKNINTMKCCFPDADIDDFMYMSKIIKSIILREDFKTLVNIMEENKLSVDDIESLLKIDKIDKIYKNSVDDKDIGKIFKKYKKDIEKMFN